MKVSAILGYSPSDIDEAAVARALEILCPEAAFEIRGLPMGTSRVCRSADEGVRAAASMSGGIGTYYTLNPCRADLDRPAREGDILARRWLMLDIDPTRPKDSNATAAEKEAALDVAYKILSYLTTERGWPSPVVVDSGNGFHLLFKCDLGTDKLTKQYVKALLVALAARFDTAAVKLDPSVHNNARIAKLPGTWSRKGPHSDERPHRKCELLWVPSSIEPVTLEQIRAELPAQPTASPAAAPSPARAAVTSIERYCQRALESAACAVLLALEGTRHVTLRDQAYALAGYLYTGGITEFELRRVLRPAGIRCGLPEKEVDSLIETGIAKGREAPRQLPAELRAKVQEAARAKGKAEQEEERVVKRIVTGLDEATPEDVQWLWPDCLALGFITILAGRTGMGKSLVVCDFAARMSRGDSPTFRGGPLRPANTLFISEDPINTMLAPRLLGMRAVPTRIKFMTFEAMAGYKLADLEMLEQAYEESGKPALIVIDPPANFLGGKDEHKNAEVRQTIMNIVAWIDRYKVAVILISHFNKQAGKGLDGLDRVMGSVAWNSVCRISLGVCKDPDDPEKCIFGGLKNNLGDKARPLSYSIEPIPGEGVPHVVWHGEAKIDMNEALNGEKRKSRGVVATEWLIERFRERSEWPSDELRRDALEAGLSKNALFSPEVAALPIKRRQVINAGGDRHWVWRAMDGWPPPIAGQAPEPY